MKNAVRAVLAATLVGGLVTVASPAAVADNGLTCNGVSNRFVSTNYNPGGYATKGGAADIYLQIMGLCSGGSSSPASWSYVALQGASYSGGMGIAQIGYAHKLNGSGSQVYCKFTYAVFGNGDPEAPTYYKCTQAPGNHQVWDANWYYQSDGQIHLLACTDNTYTNCNDVEDSVWMLDIEWSNVFEFQASEAGQWQSDVNGTSSTHAVFNPMNQRTTSGWSAHDLNGPYIDCSAFYDGFYDANSNNSRMTTWTINDQGGRTC